MAARQPQRICKLASSRSLCSTRLRGTSVVVEGGNRTAFYRDPLRQHGAVGIYGHGVTKAFGLNPMLSSLLPRAAGYFPSAARAFSAGLARYNGNSTVIASGPSCSLTLVLPFFRRTLKLMGFVLPARSVTTDRTQDCIRHKIA
jgi:hypothetical protein